jgi:hypothetical protein
VVVVVVEIPPQIKDLAEVEEVEMVVLRMLRQEKMAEQTLAAEEAEVELELEMALVDLVVRVLLF